MLIDFLRTPTQLHGWVDTIFWINPQSNTLWDKDREKTEHN